MSSPFSPPHTSTLGPGASSDAPKSSPPPVRRYPFRLADDNNVHPLFARLKVRSEASELFGIESVILEFLNCLASVSALVFQVNCMSST